MIKLFEQFNDEQEIRDICTQYNIKDYTINDDRSIDVDGDVNLSHKKLDKLPLKFNRVSGYFDCSNNKLTSLKGSPNYVGGVFYCYNNLLNSLDDGPEYADSNFDCSFNNLTTLEGCPDSIKGNLHCINNQLTSLKGCPKEIGGHFNCSNNYLTTLEECGEIKGDFFCSFNKLTSLKGCPEYITFINISNNPINKIDVECDVNRNIYLSDTNLASDIRNLNSHYKKMLFKHGLDYNIFNEDGTINDSRLQHFINDFKE